MRPPITGTAPVTSVEIPASTVQRGDVIQLGGCACCLSLDGEMPQGLARIYTPRDLASVGALDEGPARQEALAHFAVLGPPPAAIRETVCARSATPDEASALKIPSATAVLAVTRVATDSTGRVIEAALLTFPGDRVDAVFTTHHAINERHPSP
ncbi:UTRA domain-containing protein [Streptomyces griseoluteus]|uniref:UTRA domain-containing protein n=1 Tax=Streptomyces griseoluteus TaxID=29306 RepID=UPI003F4DA12F